MAEISSPRPLRSTPRTHVPARVNHGVPRRRDRRSVHPRVRRVRRGGHLRPRPRRRRRPHPRRRRRRAGRARGIGGEAGVPRVHLRVPHPIGARQDARGGHAGRRDRRGRPRRHVIQRRARARGRSARRGVHRRQGGRRGRPGRRAGRARRVQAHVDRGCVLLAQVPQAQGERGAAQRPQRRRERRQGLEARRRRRRRHPRRGRLTGRNRPSIGRRRSREGSRRGRRVRPQGVQELQLRAGRGGG